MKIFRLAFRVVVCFFNIKWEGVLRFAIVKKKITKILLIYFRKFVTPFPKENSCLVQLFACKALYDTLLALVYRMRQTVPKLTWYSKICVFYRESKTHASLTQCRSSTDEMNHVSATIMIVSNPFTHMRIV